MRGRTSRVPDPTADRLRLTAEARHEAEQRQAAAAELALAGSLHGATISPAARNLLLDLVGELLARQATKRYDHDARPAAARGPRPGHRRHQPGRDDHLRRPQPPVSRHRAVDDHG